MRIALVCFAVAACSQPAPSLVKPPSQQAERTPVTEVPTCADMGPLLRGPMADEDTEGPKKEAVIVESCKREKWSQAVLDCVAGATEPTAQDCLEQLPQETLARYNEAIEKFGPTRDPDDPPPDAEAEETSCEDAFSSSSVEDWPPVAKGEADRSLAAKLRRPALQKQCTDQKWDLAVRTCIATTPATGIDRCFALLDSARAAALERALREADELRDTITQAKGKPASVTCAKAVAAHYGPAKWRGKAPELEGAARTKAIEASRKALLAQCTSTWSEDARACVVASDSDACMALGALGPAWGYPATGALPLPSTGITECDEYGAAVLELARCSVIPEGSRQMMLDAFTQAAEGWKSLPADQKDAARGACAAARDATRQALVPCT